MKKEKKILTQDECVEILNLTYSRIMRLKFSYMFLCPMIFDYHTNKYYPNLCYSLKVSFVTDAYTTINSIYSDGIKSLERLSSNNGDISKLIKSSKLELKKMIPDFESYRNQIFCHLNKQYNSEAITAMVNHFESIMYEVCGLHAKCCNAVNVLEDMLHGYSSETFMKLQEEEYSFCDLLLKGYSAKMTEELHDKIANIMRGDKNE